MIYDNLGKKAEQKLRNWLDRPEQGYCLDRLPDQMTGFYGSKNICDFTLFKSPYMYYIESKATWADRFDFSMITDYQYENLLKKSRITNVYGVIIILFATEQRAFIIDINEIDRLKQAGKKSINIKKLDSWDIKYTEINTIPSKKALLDYIGELIIKE
ncbi:MAG: Holliday junction resolvase RecU [Bacteroidaceae bacterium]|nr:Holliday junction resolvase RecU [Bacteroidaceae bacterium]